jgi:hypothetical protein
VRGVLSLETSRSTSLTLDPHREFGNDTDSIDEKNWLYFKKEVHHDLEKLGLPYALYFTGPFADSIVQVLGPKDGKIVLVGKSEAPSSFTKISDAADFIAYTLTRKRGAENELATTWADNGYP